MEKLRQEWLMLRRDSEAGRDLEGEGGMEKLVCP